MKILISDYKASMMPTHEYEKAILSSGLPDAEIEVYEYTDEKRDEFLEKMHDVTALLTAFIPITKEVFEFAPNLQVISINATGYDNVDLTEATKHSVGVCPVGEYCTADVAEHTIALILALNKNLKRYTYDIEEKAVWEYDVPQIPTRICNQTLGIFGFGKIGRRVAKMAKGLGMNVIANDIVVTQEVADEYGVKMVSPDEIYKEADIISNHMNLENSNKAYFTKTEFQKMEKKPIFLNMARGLSISEDDLAEALDSGVIRAAGLDVLKDETPALKDHQLAHRDNVIITPHAAFYSRESFEDMQRISCENIVYLLTGQIQKVFKLVNEI